jgi:hypothetical protein
MISKVTRYAFAPLVALCAMPLFLAPSAEAAFVSCLAGTSKAVPHYGGATTFSTECVSGFLSTSTDVAGQARINTNNTAVESNLTWAGNVTNPHAYAYGYRIGGNGVEFIPGCVADDTSANGAWRSTTCSSFVVRVALVVNGS